jgi:hypothetical protein
MRLEAGEMERVEVEVLERRRCAAEQAPLLESTARSACKGLPSPSGQIYLFYAPLHKFSTISKSGLSADREGGRGHQVRAREVVD